MYPITTACTDSDVPPTRRFLKREKLKKIIDQVLRYCRRGLRDGDWKEWGIAKYTCGL